MRELYYCDFVDVFRISSKREMDREKNIYYTNKLTEQEQEKTNSLLNRMNDFTTKVFNEEVSKVFSYKNKGEIQYRSTIGYYTIGNYDRDVVKILYYGSTEEEAFINLLIGIGFDYGTSEYVWPDTKEKLEREFFEKYKDNDTYEDPSLFFYIELAIQLMRTYFGDKIPEEIINYYIKHILEYDNVEVEYNYDTNELIYKGKIKKRIK